MKISNTSNQVAKQVEVDDIVYMPEKYRISGETKSSWRLEYCGDHPKVKKNETWNKNTFAKKFFFNGRYFTFIQKMRMPNMDYL